MRSCRPFAQFAGALRLWRSLAPLVLTLAAAALLLAGQLPAQVPANTTPPGATNTTSSTVRTDSPQAVRPAAAPAAAGASTRTRGDSTGAAEMERNAKDGGWSRFPRPVGWAVATIILMGALGALAGDLVTDGARLDRWRRDETGWVLGYPGRLLIGVVVALIVVLGIKPPDGSWPMLISTALAVGAASEAVLLAVMASWKVRAAEFETRRVRNVAVEKIETMRVGIHAATARPTTRAAATSHAMEAHHGDGLAEQVDRLAERAKAELLAETGQPATEPPASPLLAPAIRGGLVRESFGRNMPVAGIRAGGPLRTEAAVGRKTVVITYNVPDSDFAELRVDDVPIPSDGDGVHRALVGPGEHVLHCRAQTRPGVEYEVEITDPEEARWKPDPPRTAAPSGIINDFESFRING